MHLLIQAFSIFSTVSVCCSLALPPTTVSSPAPPQSESSINAYPPSATYIVPTTNIKVKVTRAPGFIRPIQRADLVHLIETGKVALDLLAQHNGGDHAELPDNMPRIRWAISGLAIQTNDATRTTTTTAGGPLRFDEVMAAYTGLLVAEGKIGNVECGFGIWRVSPHLRREIKFLGWGNIRHALLGDVPARNMTVDTA